MALLPPSGWTGDASAIRRTYRFADFRAAMAFMVEASYACEAANHHPEWSNVWNRVEVTLTTHDAGNRVTDEDIALAEAMDAIFARRSA